MVGSGLRATPQDPTPASTTSRILLGDSEAEFEGNWIEKGFPFIAATDYHLEMSADGASVVKGISNGGNRSLHRELRLEQPTLARLSWRWKVQSTLTGDPAERTKGGDDYAARVFVVFEHSWIPTRIRAINYVWAAREDVGSRYTSPYSKNVHNIVLRTRSDESTANTWVEEERDVLADYLACFGEPPSVLNAVAIMVDSDNTKCAATGWFADLSLVSAIKH